MNLKLTHSDKEFYHVEWSFKSASCKFLRRIKNIFFRPFCVTMGARTKVTFCSSCCRWDGKPMPEYDQNQKQVAQKVNGKGAGGFYKHFLKWHTSLYISKKSNVYWEANWIFYLWPPHSTIKELQIIWVREKVK